MKARWPAVLMVAAVAAAVVAAVAWSLGHDANRNDWHER